MSQSLEKIAALIESEFGDSLQREESTVGELGYVVSAADLLEVCEGLKTHPELAVEQLIDLCGVDYLLYGQDEWQTNSATDSGFSRGVERKPVILDESESFDPQRFAVVYQLMSVSKNYRLRLKMYTGEQNPPVVPSVTSIWSSADWYEREAFDLFGIFFDGHPDLRRILTDYGFIGHPFRKDFPLSGNVEVTYDADKGRVVYQPVTIEERTLVPRVIREDNRYDEALKDR